MIADCGLLCRPRSGHTRVNPVGNSSTTCCTLCTVHARSSTSSSWRVWGPSWPGAPGLHIMSVTSGACRQKGEGDNTDWLEKSYLRAPWNGWWCGASEETGVTCSNNDLESFWRSLKSSMLTSKRVGHRKLLEDVFPKMVFLVAQGHVGPPTRTSHHISANTRDAAHQIYVGSKTPIYQHALGIWLVNSQHYAQVCVLTRHTVI